jgi:hypothetical protein
MSLSKKEQAIQSAIRASVIAEITERGTRTGDELKSSLGIGVGILPSMIKARVLESKFSGKVDDNGNRIMLYALPGKECKRVEIEPGPTLFDLWPVSVPNVSVEPRIFAERHLYNTALIGKRVRPASCHSNLMMYCGE